jgi:hypothetical protein
MPLMSIQRHEFIDALTKDYADVIADDFDPDNDLTVEQYREWLNTLADEELVTLT